MQALPPEEDESEEDLDAWGGDLNNLVSPLAANVPWTDAQGEALIRCVMFTLMWVCVLCVLRVPAALKQHAWLSACQRVDQPWCVSVSRLLSQVTKMLSYKCCTCVSLLASQARGRVRRETLEDGRCRAECHIPRAGHSQQVQQAVP